MPKSGNIQTVRQRNIARDWWWEQTEQHRISLCHKYKADVSLCVPQLINANVAYAAFEGETGKKISEL